MNETRKDIRTLAIIAHVDHGKTTLIDGLLRQAGAFRSHQVVAERAMDSGDLERERGITILSKSTSIDFEGVRLQIVDTPGHADFGAEVERILGMVDGVLLVVDSVEGVMPQTRFVVRKAIERGLRPILVVNKIDRPEQRAEAVVDEVFDLLVELGADDGQLDFPVVYASAKEGSASLAVEAARSDLRPLFHAILEHVPPPDVSVDGPVRFQAVTLGYDEFVGRLVIGRVERGRLSRGTPLIRIAADGPAETFRITKLFGFQGLDRVELEAAQAGDVVMIAGVDSIEIGDTVADPAHPEPLPRIEVDPPTIRVSFAANTSPFAGREGQFVTARQLEERLRREALSNVSIRLEKGEGESYVVAARGELQLAVLMETLRREGYEFAASRPEIILRELEGRTCEPVEDVSIEVPEASAGAVMEGLVTRKARLESMENRGGRVHLRFVAPSRGLFGYRTVFLTDTRGEGVLHRTVRGYEPFAGDLTRRRVGAIVVSESGSTTAYSLFHVQERSTLFLGAGVPVYEGQIIGENRRAGDMVVNACKPKKLTNVRAAGKDENTVLSPPRQLTLESALEWIEIDELLEVTPRSLRLRKRELSASRRKRS